MLRRRVEICIEARIVEAAQLSFLYASDNLVDADYGCLLGMVNVSRMRRVGLADDERCSGDHQPSVNFLGAAFYGTNAAAASTETVAIAQKLRITKMR